MNRMGHTKRGEKNPSAPRQEERKRWISIRLFLFDQSIQSPYFFFLSFSKSNYTLAATVCQHTNEHLLLLSFYRSLGEGGRHRFPPLAQLVAFRGDRIGGGARRRPASRR